MNVQHIFISISESALIRNLTLFSIIAVDNPPTCAGYRKLGNACCRKAHFCIGRNSFPTFTLLRGNVSFPPHLIGTQRILGGLRFDLNCRRYPIILNFTILP